MVEAFSLSPSLQYLLQLIVYTMLASVLVAAGAFVASASAHATFQEMWVNGVDMGSACVRLPASNNPVTDVTSTVRYSYFDYMARWQLTNL